MAKILSALAFASLIQFGSAASAPIPVSDPAKETVPDSGVFVSYSIEFAFFLTLLVSFITELYQYLILYIQETYPLPYFFKQPAPEPRGSSGTRPYIRVGGNTQDYALYNSSLKEAINGTYNLARSADYPTTIFIGPSYFESYHTWPNTKFSHGFNLGLGGNNTAG